MNKPQITIILTGYNEGPTVTENLHKVQELLKNSKYKWEMILFDDKSSDGTPIHFKSFAQQNKHVRAFFHSKNKGRGRTVKDAIKKAKGDIVGYIDTDLELSPIYIFEFVNKIQNGADISIGRRYYTIGMSNLVRAIFSRGYIFLVQRLLKLPFRDTEAGFKFFDRKKILPVLRKVEDERWFFDTEILAKSYMDGLKIVEVPVVYIRNENKKTSVKLLRDSLAYFNKLLKFKKSYKGQLQ